MSDDVEVTRGHFDRGPVEKLRAMMAVQDDACRLIVSVTGRGVRVIIRGGPDFEMTYVGAKLISNSLLECLAEAKKLGLIPADDLKIIEGQS